MVDFRVMSHGDEAFFMRLMDMVGWGMTSSDLTRMLVFSPDGVFIASVDGVDLGMVAAISYGSIAWIGNLVVLPEARGEGLGAALMRRAMDYLIETGVTSIRLDGVPLAVSLYHRLGFRDEYWSLRYTGTAQKHTASGTRKMTQGDLSMVFELDESVFMGSRRDVLRYVLEQNPEMAFTAWEGDELVGFIMAKRGKTNVKIGPWICREGYSTVAESLLHSLMNMVHGEELWVGLPEGNVEGVKILESNGFKALPSSLRMCYGECSVVENVREVYGLGGPDKG